MVERVKRGREGGRKVGEQEKRKGDMEHNRIGESFYAANQ